MLVCNVVLVSDEQQSDSIICVCVCVCVCFFRIFPLWALLQDIEHSSLCSTVDPRCLFYGQ